MTKQSKNNNLNYLIDPTFTNLFNKLIVLSFEIESDRTSIMYQMLKLQCVT